MPTMASRAAKKALQNIELLAELPFVGVKDLTPLTPHASAMRAVQNNLDEAEADIQLRMNQSRFHNARMKNRYLDHFAAEEMADPQMVQEAEQNIDRQKAVLNLVLEKLFHTIEVRGRAHAAVEQLRW